MSETHSHACAHHAAPKDFGRAFAVGVVLNLGFVAIEAGAGFFANSLALLADAGHNLSDVLGLALAWGAAVASRRAPSKLRTYGWRRMSILAALINAVLLFVAVGGIAWEALRRIEAPPQIETALIVWVAGAGIVINILTALLFIEGRKRDLNVRGAYLHMLADAAVSAGVVVAAVLISRTGWLWLDPATSLAIAAVIAFGTWGLMRDSLNLALDAVPAHVDPGAVMAYLRNLPGVSDVHDLHIWGMSTTHSALTVHLVRAQGSDDALLDEVQAHLHLHFGIDHATIQIETGSRSFDCPQKSNDIV